MLIPQRVDTDTDTDTPVVTLLISAKKVYVARAV
jgi:hypothetical protein